MNSGQRLRNTRYPSITSSNEGGRGEGSKRSWSNCVLCLGVGTLAEEPGSHCSYCVGVGTVDEIAEKPKRTSKKVAETIGGSILHDIFEPARLGKEVHVSFQFGGPKVEQDAARRVLGRERRDEYREVQPMKEAVELTRSQMNTIDRRKSRARQAKVVVAARVIEEKLLARKRRT